MISLFHGKSPLTLGRGADDECICNSAMGELLTARISKRAAATQLDWHPRPHVQCGRMLIDRSCRLGAAVAIRVVEIQGGDAMFTEGAFEGGAAVHRFGCVISHTFSVVLLLVRGLGQ